ncbi:Retrovirus-related Pol polyprotein from transposon RE1 [Bienertia sinuspersici]
MALIARNKLQFVDGTLPNPGIESPDYQKWLRNDYMVMSWLLNSIDKSLAESFMFFNSSAELWREIAERFGHSNAPQLFELHRNLSSTTQNDDSIAEYFGRLKSCWDQKLLVMEQRKRLMQLLAGLNKEFDQVKTNSLSQDPLPTVNKAYHTLQQIEQQHKLNQVVSNSVELNALNASATPTVSKVFPKPNFQYKKDFKRIKSDIVCSYCKRIGHSVDHCFKLHGFPEWYVNLKGKTNVKLVNNANVSNGVLGSSSMENGETSAFVVQNASNVLDPTVMTAIDNDFVKMMQNGASSAGNPLSSTANMAGIAIVSHVDSMFQHFNNDSWIIDTEASDHMIGNINLFVSLHKISNPIRISLPDGTINCAVYAGIVHFTPDIFLQDVLFVPVFKHNLLSVGKLLDQHHLYASFKKDSCMFQDLITHEVKAVGTRHSGLYKFSSFPDVILGFTYANNLLTKSVTPKPNNDMVIEPEHSEPNIVLPSSNSQSSSSEFLPLPVSTSSSDQPIVRHSTRPKCIPKKFHDFELKLPGIH